MKASRLLALLLVLQTRQRIGTAELAERFEVSRRTVLRDVDALSAAGVPVYAERGRLGGIVLLPGARLNASHLEPGELESLSVAGLDADQLETFGLAAERERAGLKIAARRTATPGADDAGPRLADLVTVENIGWMDGTSPGVDIASLALELRARRRLRISYRHSSQPVPTVHVVDPYGLAGKGGRWYLVADEGATGRLYSLERLESHESLAEPAILRAGQSLRSLWTELRSRTEAVGRVEVTARLRASRVDLARRILGTRLHDVSASDRDWCTVTVRYPDIESVRQLLQFADHLEVLAPAAARDRVAELSADLARRHAEQPG